MCLRFGTNSSRKTIKGRWEGVFLTTKSDKSRILMEHDTWVGNNEKAQWNVCRRWEIPNSIISLELMKVMASPFNNRCYYQAQERASNVVWYHDPRVEAFGPATEGVVPLRQSSGLVHMASSSGITMRNWESVFWSGFLGKTQWWFWAGIPPLRH